MKNFIYTLYIIVLTLLASCSESTIDTLLSTTNEEEGTPFTISFNMEIPTEASPTATRAFGEESAFNADNATITLLAFDENHKLTNIYHGEYLESSGTSYTYKVTLRTTDKKRIFHVIVSDEAFTPGDDIYGFESEIFNHPSAVVKNGNAAYWARFEVNNVQNTSNSEITSALQHVQLVRNFCKIELTLGSAITNTLKDVKWGLANVPTQGSIAPYISGEAFANYITPSGTSASYTTLEKEQGYYGHIPRTSNSFYSVTSVSSNNDITWVDKDTPIYCYENEGSSRDENWKETSIFICGTNTETNAVVYYRISIVDPDNNYEPFDLLRNIVYNIEIERLTSTGYSSAAEAWNRPAGNNLSGSTHTAAYPIITINKAALRVEYVKKYILSPDPFTMYYRYVEDVSTTTDDEYEASNDKVLLVCGTDTLEQGKEYPNYAFKSFSIANEDYNTNYRQITFTPNPITSESAVTTAMRVGVEGKPELYRNITFYLRQRYLLKSMSITKGDDDNSFVLGLKVPANLPDELFPLEFTLETYPVCIYADVSSGTVMNTECTSTSIFTDEEKDDATFQFLRRITKSDFSALESVDGYRTINFYFRFNGVALETGTNSVLFGIYNESFSADPEADRNESTPSAFKKSFTVTKESTDAYTVE